MRWFAVFVCVCAAGCTTEVVPLPGECEALVLREKVSLPVLPRARLLVLTDPGVPDDLRNRIAGTADVLRTGDIGDDGSIDFPPLKAVELVSRVGALDGPLTPIVSAEVPTGWTADATLLYVVIATSSDLSPSVVDEAKALAAVRGGEVGFVGLPTCSTPSEGVAGLMTELGADGAAAMSIDTCDASWVRDLLGFLVPRIGSGLGGGLCLPRAVDLLEDGLRACDVYETPIADAPFDCTLPGRVADPTPDDPRRCRIVQQAAEGAIPSEPGWYWDDFTDRAAASCGREGQTISFSGGVEISEGSTVELVCLTQAGACGAPE